MFYLACTRFNDSTYKDNIDYRNNNNEDVHSKKSINDVFINIRKLYSVNERSILFHLLTLMEKHPDQYQTYIDAINAALMPVNQQIKKWINDNIVY